MVDITDLLRRSGHPGGVVTRETLEAVEITWRRRYPCGADSDDRVVEAPTREGAIRMALAVEDDADASLENECPICREIAHA